LEAGYVAGTTKKYKKVVHEFFSWCDDHGLEANDYYMYELDNYLSDFMHRATFILNTNRAEDNYVQMLYLEFNGMLLPRTKDKLQVSERILNRRGKAHPSVAYPPLTWDGFDGNDRTLSFCGGNCTRMHLTV
jgi:hypothetical protein